MFFFVFGWLLPNFFFYRLSFVYFGNTSNKPDRTCIFLLCLKKTNKLIIFHLGFLHMKGGYKSRSTSATDLPLATESLVIEFLATAPSPATGPATVYSLGTNPATVSATISPVATLSGYRFYADVQSFPP